MINNAGPHMEKKMHIKLHISTGFEHHNLYINDSENCFWSKT